MNRNYHASIGQDEVRPGLALFLSPRYLRDVGGASTQGPHREVQGNHFFVCLEADTSHSLWVPASTKNGPGRALLSSREKTGAASWRQPISFCNVGEIWTLPNALASDWAFLDESRPHQRNRVTRSALARLRCEAQGENLCSLWVFARRNGDRRGARWAA